MPRQCSADLAPESFTKRVRWVADRRVVRLLAVVLVTVPPGGGQLRHLPFVCHVPRSAVAGMQPHCKAQSNNSQRVSGRVGLCVSTLYIPFTANQIRMRMRNCDQPGTTPWTHA